MFELLVKGEDYFEKIFLTIFELNPFLHLKSIGMKFSEQLSESKVKFKLFIIK